MRLSWLVVIPAIYIIVALVSGMIWGFSATFSMLIGAGAFVIAGVFMLWIRFGRRPTVGAGAEEEPFAGYPEGHVLAGLPPTGIEGAQSELRNAGFEHDVLAGLPGEAELDPEGEAHGTTERVERGVERLFADVDDLRGYRDIVMEGNAVLRIRVDNDEEARAVADLLQHHGGYQIHYFGTLMVQRMDVEPERTQSS